jgi:hypothetical protein
VKAKQKMIQTQATFMHSHAHPQRRHLAVVGLLLLVSSVSAVAEERPENAASTETTNIGFEKNPPAALKRKFPICDTFLKVLWINRKEQIGYSEFEAPSQDKNGKSIGRRKVSVLVMMKPEPEMRYEVSYYKEQGQPLCWNAARISALCRSNSATPTYVPPRSIRTFSSAAALR